MNEALCFQPDTNVDAEILKNETETLSGITKNALSKIGNITSKISLINHVDTLESKSAPRKLVTQPVSNTRVTEIIATQPNLIDKKKQEKSALRKLQARIKEKTVSLEKALDAYGVIDNLVRAENEYEIHARIYDLENHEILDEITFSSSEFSKSDQQKLVENAIFYWYVGIEKSLMGQERRVSEFRLRRVFNPQTI